MSSKKRVRSDSENPNSVLDSVEAKRILLDTILDDSEVNSVSQDLDSFIKTFQEEITPSSPEPSLGFLFEASDDELGLPPTSQRVLAESVEHSELWKLDDQITSYDSFEYEFGYSDVNYSYNNDNDNSYYYGDDVAIDGLFDHTDLGVSRINIDVNSFEDMDTLIKIWLLSEMIDLSSPIIQNEELYLSSSTFESCDDLLKSVRAFYYTKGYGLSIRDSQKDKYVTLQCQRSGSYRDVRNIGDKRKRSTTSRLIECPFQIGGKKGQDGSWVFKVINLEHNHEPSTDMSGHPSFRRLEPDDVQSVKSMTISGIPPRQILTSLRQQTPNLPANSRTIYNLKAKIRRDDLGDRSMVMALLDELEKDIIGVSCFNTSFYSGFAFLKNEDEDSYEWALNAFKKILGDSNQPSVIITDRELALMNGIKKVFPTTTISCFNTSFYSGFAFLKNEDEDSYEWALNAFKKILGDSNQPSVIITDRELALMNGIKKSTTEALFNKNWADFELFYKGKKDALEYMKKNWFPWKEKFVSAWTEKYLHFGNRASSRAEGAHAKLKKYLQVSTGDFQQVKKKLCLAIRGVIGSGYRGYRHEFNEIKVRLASERIKVPHNCNTPIFRELLSNLSLFALKEIHKQYVKAKDGKMTSCTGHFMATMGLPCAHKIKHMKGNVLSLDLVHSHWRIDTLSLIPEDDSHDDDANKFVTLLDELRSKYQVWPLHKKEFTISMITKLVNKHDIVFEPVIQRPRGRPPKAKKKRGITSKTRDPSRFEYVESSNTHNPSSSNHEDNLIDLKNLETRSIPQVYFVGVLSANVDNVSLKFRECEERCEPSNVSGSHSSTNFSESHDFSAPSVFKLLLEQLPCANNQVVRTADLRLKVLLRMEEWVPCVCTTSVTEGVWELRLYDFALVYKAIHICVSELRRSGRMRGEQPVVEENTIDDLIDADVENSDDDFQPKNESKPRNSGSSETHVKWRRSMILGRLPETTPEKKASAGTKGKKRIAVNA
ncbi:protein FAR1-RELATED SEQUENCE 5 [Artemisia annua]|uniref:Protein FAR1-RELATED SEQUENCE 5 n=1 Tax=Artemisia annua TaxID=35608 RepID=A0A2U1PMA4_ARTAN|nr:protein FAR1-RELATED SEQUENCE 5 [Artemisia annua]